MEPKSPGPYCSKIHLLNSDITENAGVRYPHLQNGAVLELVDYATGQGMSLVNVCKFLLSTCDKQSSISATRTAVATLQKKKAKLRGEKRKDFLDKQFLFPAVSSDLLTSGGVVPSVSVSMSIDYPAPVESTGPLEIQIPTVASDVPTVVPSEPMVTDFPVPECSTSAYTPVCIDKKTVCKKQNLELWKTKRQIKQLKKTLSILNDKKEKCISSSGHYAPHNVRRREARLRAEIRSLKSSLAKAHQIEISQRLQIVRQNQVLATLTGSAEKKDRLKCALHLEKKKAVYHKGKLQKALNEKDTLQKTVNDSIKKIKELVSKVSILEKEMSGLEEERKKFEDEVRSMKEKDFVEFKARDHGILKDNVRQCVFDMIGLEVSAENVGPAIGSVLNAVGVQYNPDELPKRQCVVDIADEGHFLVKKLYAEKLQETSSWGVNKDGTSRQKKHIVTSTLSLANGEELPLGYQHVARETGERLSQSVQRELEELGEVNSFHVDSNDNADSHDGQFLETILTTLSTFMGDRAANEKKSNELLIEWREAILSESNVDGEAIHSFFCMAHALLGFHSYAFKNFDKQQEKYRDEEVKLGREGNGAYHRFGYEFVVKRCVRLGSDILGPLGDEKSGLRETWLAYCRNKGIKSLIQNYKDNRFNAIFEIGAQIFHHRLDIIDFLSKLEKRNLKVQSVLLDLSDPRVQSMLHAVAVVFLHVTGPYWDMVNSKHVPYLHLYRFIQPLEQALIQWKTNPLDVNINTVFADFPPDVSSTLFQSAQTPISEPRFFSDTLTSLLDGILHTIECQLQDFREGGQYGQEPTDEDLQRTQHSKLTNLSCERQFGSLDANQNRRRHASLHHHTTVNLLKKNRKQLSQYLNSKSQGDKKHLFLTARKGGRLLRKKHQKEASEEKQAQVDVLLQHTEAAARKQGKKSSCKKGQRAAAAECHPTETISIEPATNDWVAVAYDNGWYPGYVVDREGTDVVVNFMHPSTVSGQFKYPARPDQTVVAKQFIFSSPLLPPIPTSGGRIFRLEHYTALCQQYKDFMKTMPSQ